MQIQNSGAQVYFSCHNLGCGNAILCSLVQKHPLNSVANCNFVNSHVGSENIPRFPKKTPIVINLCFVMVTRATVRAVGGH